MVDSEARFDELVLKLKERNYRLTPQRVALIRILTTSDRHPSAYQLHDQLKEQFPATNLATVYKVLNALKEMGEVVQFGFSEDDNRFDGKRPYAHPHLICIQCRDVADAKVSQADTLADIVARDSGFQVVRQRLDFYGICPDCQGDS